jgi:hypothetical protein
MGYYALKSSGSRKACYAQNAQKNYYVFSDWRVDMCIGNHKMLLIGTQGGSTSGKNTTP